MGEHRVHRGFGEFVMILMISILYQNNFQTSFICSHFVETHSESSYSQLCIKCCAIQHATETYSPNLHFLVSCSPSKGLLLSAIADTVPHTLHQQNLGYGAMAKCARLWLRRAKTFTFTLKIMKSSQNDNNGNCIHNTHCKRKHLYCVH